MKARGAGLALIAAVLGACSRAPAVSPPSDVAAKYAILETKKGRIVARLYTARAPKTTAHFIGLATGEKQWRDPRDKRVRLDPLFDGLIFHRVIPGFMIQTGDPRGDGTGDIGYHIDDEFHPELSFDKPGILGMANTGPDANGSQFFITEAPAPDLNGRHTVFGEVIEGLDVVKKIARVPSSSERDGNRPLDPEPLLKLTIVDKAP